MHCSALEISCLVSRRRIWCGDRDMSCLTVYPGCVVFTSRMVSAFTLF